MRIIALSDLHNRLGSISKKLPDGDMIVFAGDLTNNGSIAEISAFNSAIVSAGLDRKYKDIVCIAGNHDLLFEQNYNLAKTLIPNVNQYLQHNLININGLNIFGSPYTPEFGMFAFQKPREQMKNVWDSLPQNIDILVTHGPPFGILDSGKYSLSPCGCVELYIKVMKVKPVIHIFGHIHDGAGYIEKNGTLFVNAAKGPVVIDIDINNKIISNVMM